MSLTPKDWAEFQHYKDRSPPWIKLHKSLLTNYEFFCLPVASRALAPLLWLLASEYEDGVITASHAALAFRLHMKDADFATALKPLIDYGFFTDASVMLAPRKQAAIPETEAYSKETEKNICNLEFEKFRRGYPKRKGSQGWPSAERHFQSAVKSGHDPTLIVEAARKFATTVESAVGTEFIPMAETWLRKKCFLEFIPTPEEIQRAAKVEEFLASKGYASAPET
jgi:hypothetical protein